MLNVREVNFSYANFVFVIKFGSSLKFHSLLNENVMNNTGEQKEYIRQKGAEKNDE